VLIRVARTAAAVLEHRFQVGETAVEVDPSTSVTVALVDANGVPVTSGAATAEGNAYSFPLPPQAQLTELTATWTGTIDGNAVVEVDQVEIVGAHYWSIAEARASDATLANAQKYPAADLLATRVEVEQECERICGRAFVPRYRRAVLDGTGTTELLLPDPDVRRIRAVRLAPRVDRPFVALTEAQLAALVERGDRVLRRVDGSVWTEGYANVVVEYEHGMNAPPTDLLRATKQRLRHRLNMQMSAIPDRAVSYSTEGGATYRLSTPDAYSTGIPDIDAVYSGWSLRPSSDGNGQSGPASRSLNFDPQRHSLFHGGER
jgi:hypothetical protein